jgi:hypothetical protein
VIRAGASHDQSQSCKKNLERIRPPGRGRDECSQHGQLMGHSAERDWPKAVIRAGEDSCYSSGHGDDLPEADSRL